MNLDISYLPKERVPDHLGALLTFLKTSEKWTFGRSTLGDILQQILSGQLQLWVVFHADSGQIAGHIITEIKQYPQFKLLVVQNCAMEPHIMQHVADKMQSIAESFAKDTGCAGIEFVGRPGWGKHVEKYGYDVQHVTYQKFFKDAP